MEATEGLRQKSKGKVLGRATLRKDSPLWRRVRGGERVGGVCEGGVRLILRRRSANLEDSVRRNEPRRWGRQAPLAGPRSVLYSLSDPSACETPMPETSRG